MSAFEDFTRLHHADVVIVMAIDIDLATGGQVHRQVLVHSVNPSYRDQVRPNLQLHARTHMHTHAHAHTHTHIHAHNV